VHVLDHQQDRRLGRDRGQRAQNGVEQRAAVDPLVGSR
jgi:hypothetical protein